MSRKLAFLLIFAGVTICGVIGNCFGYPLWYAVFFSGVLFIAICIEEER